IEAHGELRVAEALGEGEPGARAVAAGKVERRLRAARIVGVLVEAYRRPNAPRAGQAQILPVAGETQVERALAQRPAQVERRVLLLVAVVVAVAVGGVAVHRAVHPQDIVRGAAVELAFEGL